MNSRFKSLICLILCFFTTTSSALTINGELKKALLEKLAADPTAYEGRIYYDTVNKSAKIYNGVAWEDIGSGSGGAGELSLVDNGSATATTLGWIAGTSHTITRVTTGSPLDPLVTTAFQLSSSASVVESSTSGAYDGMTMPTAFLSKKLKAEFYVTVPATDVWRVSVYQGTTRLALSTDSSGATTLPAGFTGKFTTYFDTTSATSYSLNFTKTTHSGANNLIVTNVVVGPGIQPQGAVVDEWKTYTPTFAGVGTAASVLAEWRRVGSEMQIRGSFVTGTTTGVAASLSLPSGYNVDAVFGTRLIGKAITNNTKNLNVLARPGTDSTLVYFGDNTAANSFTAIVGTTIGNTISVGYFASVAVTQFAGSGTVNLAQNDVEYVYNTAGTTAAGGSDTTAFGYGPAGAAVGSINSSTTTASFTTMRVRFQTPVQASDVVEVQVDYDSSGRWQTAAARGIHASFQNTARYGVRIDQVASSTTDFDVLFGNAGVFSTGATLGTASGTTWSGVGRWRAVKYKSGQAVGFGLASVTSSGLIGTGTQSIAGGKTIDGEADTVQLTVKGHSTQTANSFVVQSNAGATNFSVSGNGTTFINNATTINGGLSVATLNTIVPISNPGTFELTDTTVIATDEIQRFAFSADNDATGGMFIRFLDSGGEIGRIEAATAASVSYNTTSDARLKKDIADYTSGLTDVMAMQPRSFKWIESDAPDKGFIAQEMRTVFPYAVTGNPDGDITRPMGIDYGRITPALVSAIKDLKGQLDALNADYQAYKTAHP